MLAVLFVIPWVTEYGLRKKQQQKFYCLALNAVVAVDAATVLLRHTVEFSIVYRNQAKPNQSNNKANMTFNGPGSKNK